MAFARHRGWVAPGLLAGLLALAACGQPAPPQAAGGATGDAGAEAIQIVGSSTVFPFTSVVAERFGSAGAFRTPVVEMTGTGGGISQFCSGVGPQTADAVNASRRMKASEFDLCRSNGVNDIIEIKIGFDGIVVANSREGPAMALRPEDIWKALAREVFVNGQLVPNPHRTWRDVNPALPNIPILVYGPPPTSGTRDSWNELAMEAGAKRIPEVMALNDGTDAGEERFETVARTIRGDGVWINSGENDNAIVQTLTKTPQAFGVFGFSFLEENMERLQGATIGGVAPTTTDITSGRYPVSRSMYIYVKAQHLGVTPGLQEFMQEFASDRATGPQGYLTDIGLVPLPAAEHEANKAVVTNRTVMSRPEA
jgi:phosphate transport system substrate-binding protein